MFFKKKSYKNILKNTSLTSVTYAEAGKMLFVIDDVVYYKERKGSASYNIVTGELLKREVIPEIVMKIVF